MEEILASIRRIIADDQSLPQHVAEATLQPAPAPVSDGDREHIDAADAADTLAAGALAAEEPAAYLAAYGEVTAPQYPSPNGLEQGDPRAGAGMLRDDHDGHRAAVAAPAEEVSAERTAAPTLPHRSEPEQPALAESRDAAPAAILTEQPRREPSAAAPTQRPLISQATDASLSTAFNMLAATRLIDDSEELRAMARGMIQPLLKNWLDEHLPSLVERLVRTEIERVARGGR